MGLGLLASAFAPIVAVLAVLRVPALGWATWIVVGVCIVFVGLLAAVFLQVRRLQSHLVEVTLIRRADERVLGFASAYVVPAVIVLFGEESWVTGAATVALVLLLMVIYVRGELYHLNPTLTVIGFRLYEITEANGQVTMLLSRQKQIAFPGNLQYRKLSAEVAIQLKGDQ